MSETDETPSFGGSNSGSKRGQKDKQVAEEQPHVVMTNPADPRQAKTLFSGGFKDALQYLRNNFPRLHVEPGGSNPVPDAVLHAPNGDVYAHHGEGAVDADDNGLVKQEGNEQ
jgi:hypothetical protein